MCKSHKLHVFQTLVTQRLPRRFSSSKTMFPIGLTEVTTLLMARPGSRVQVAGECSSRFPQYFPQAVGVVKIVRRELFFTSHTALCQRFKPGRALQKRHADAASRAITLLRDDDFRSSLKLRIVLLIDLFPENKHNKVSVLLDRARFPEVGKLRPMVAASAFRSAAQLGQSNDRNVQFLGKPFQATGDRRNFLRTVLETLSSSRHELQVIDDDQIESSLCLFQTASLRSHFG